MLGAMRINRRQRVREKEREECAFVRHDLINTRDLKWRGVYCGRDSLRASRYNEEGQKSSARCRVNS